MLRVISLLLCSILATIPALTRAVTVNLAPTKDNTLYDNTSFPLSNAVGDHFFAGQTLSSQFSLRRGLIAFDIAGNIPAGATITSAKLTLHMSRNALDASSRIVTLHRLLADWGEGTSNAGGQEGGGASATPGDATWLHTFFNGSFWTTPGGDFMGAASASSSIGGIGFYNWMSAGMVFDVQGWLDTPASNFGWLLLGDESTAPTARRFDSRENPNMSVRPILEVQYTEQQVAVERTTWGQVKAILSGHK